MVDDSVLNLKAFIGQGLVFTAPHNALDTEFTRVNGWVDLARNFGVARRVVNPTHQAQTGKPN